MAARRAVQSTPVTASRALAFICLIAALHGLFFIWYQRPDWNTQWPDQEGYRRLGEVLATTGQFTRFPDAPAFVPEVLRTPAYPIFVALVYRVFGTHQISVALAQTALFSVVCLVVYAIGRRVASERIAWLAAMATALFPPIPYFAALTLHCVHVSCRRPCDRSTPAERVLVPAARVPARRDHAEPAGLRPVPVRPRSGRRHRSSAAAGRRAAARDALGAHARRVRHHDASLVHVQLRDSRPLHAVSGRRHRARSVGRLVAGHMVRPPPERTDAPRRRHLRSRDARCAGTRRRGARASGARADARIRPSVAGHPTHLGDADRSQRARDRAREGRPGVPTRRDAKPATAADSTSAAPAGSRHARAVGRRNSVPLQRHQRAAAAADLSVLGRPGRPRLRRRGRSHGPGATRPRRCGVGARDADRVRHRRSSPAAHRSAPIAARAADRAAARDDRRDECDRPFTSPRTAGS
ncbi:MAG: hypothetical protein DMG01_10970 [Acidobacteria bacterium]|nr:MAG: hypothetical protein DMG01_10970 [Acidobacteriota bacterium]